jgi:hypothetical protein
MEARSADFRVLFACVLWCHAEGLDEQNEKEMKPSVALLMFQCCTNIIRQSLYYKKTRSTYHTDWYQQQQVLSRR